MASLKETFEQYKTLIGILAIVATGLFFVIKLFNGWFSINMDVTVSTERTPYRNGSDVLAVTVVAENGERGTVTLMDGSVRVSCALVAGQTQTRPLQGVERIQVTDGSLRWGNVDTTRAYKIASSERLQLATVFVVPSDAVLFVDAALVSHPPRLRFGAEPSQWNATTISAPAASRGDSATTAAPGSLAQGGNRTITC